MKEIKWSALKLMLARDLVDGECLKVTTDGVTLGYLVVKPQGNMVAQIEARCIQIDQSKGLVK